MKIGLVGRKRGMTRVFTEEGDSVPVTVIEVEPNHAAARAALGHRLEAGYNEANQAQAERTHLFKTAIAAMVAEDMEAAANRTADPDRR